MYPPKRYWVPKVLGTKGTGKWGNPKGCIWGACVGFVTPPHEHPRAQWPNNHTHHAKNESMRSDEIEPRHLRHTKASRNSNDTKCKQLCYKKRNVECWRMLKNVEECWSRRNVERCWSAARKIDKKLTKNWTSSDEMSRSCERSLEPPATK